MPSTSSKTRGDSLHVLYASVGIGLLLFAAPTLKRLWLIYENSADYAHGYLVPVVVFLVLRRYRDPLRALPFAPFSPGLLPLAAGAGLMFLGIWYDVAMQPGGFGTEFVCGTGLFLLCLGAGLCLFGRAQVKLAAFAFVYLLFAIPWPQSWMLELTLALRRFVSIASAWMLEHSGNPVLRRGIVLELGKVTIGVDDACSGIRSLWTLVSCGVAIAWFYQARAGAIAGVALLSLPLAVLQNVLRVYLTAVLGNRVDPRFIDGWRHEATGWFTFLLAAILLVWAARRLSPRELEPLVVSPAPRDPPRRAGGLPLFIALLMVAGIAAQSAVFRHYGPARHAALAGEAERKALREFPKTVGGYRMEAAHPLSDRALDILQPSDHLVATWKRDGARDLRMLLFYWGPQRVGAYESTFRPHSPDVCYPSEGWEREDRQDERVTLDGQEAFARRYAQDQRARQVLFWQNQPPRELARSIPGRASARLRALVASWKQADTVAGRQFSVALDLEAGPDPLPGDAQILRDFATELLPALEPFGLRTNAN